MNRKQKIFKDPVVLFGLLILAFLFSYSSLNAQGVFAPVESTVMLDEQQQHYLTTAQGWIGTGGYDFVQINMDAFDSDRLLINYQGLQLESFRAKLKGANDLSRKSWIGGFVGANGYVNLVYNKGNDLVTGQVQFEDISFLVVPLGDGLHALIRMDMSADELCATSMENGAPSGITKEQMEKHLNKADPDLQQAMSSPPVGSKATGECSIRVLVVYTTATAGAVADILSSILTMVNSSNISYANNQMSLTYSIELAAAYETSYTAVSNIETNRNRFKSTNDAYIDDVHSQRSLWRADQCHLLVSTGGGGIAYISTAFADQFCVTDVGNFGALTFQHELGHLNECTHETGFGNGGTAPFAGWGDQVNGCFRTVMAYPDACNGVGSCPRQLIWSDNDSNWWACGGNNVTPGTSNARNQDRLVLSYPTIVSHNTVSVATSYSGDYDWWNNEAVHFVASSSVGYNSAGVNKFDLHNGSEGSFRASDYVVLGEGFHARTGSDFRAYIESCP